MVTRLHTDRIFKGKQKIPSFLGLAALLLVISAAYSNHFQNSFHFDDAHTIVNNAAIRELRNIPLFFRDATSFSSLPSNQSYRPLVSTLVAIDYKLAGGLQPFWFHLSIFALFIVLVLLLAFVIHRLLDHVENSSRNGWIALLAWRRAEGGSVEFLISGRQTRDGVGHGIRYFW